MDTIMKVFKIPDGNGNIRYRVQTPDGVWHDTDEDGNYLPPVSRETNGVIREHKSRRSPKSEGRINLGVAFSQEEYKLFSDYIHWRCLFKEECSKGPFLVNLVLDVIRKDKEYCAFRETMDNKEE